jgi:hypothetical protein
VSARIVNADIAADWNHHEGDLTEGDLAHTVVVQAEQIEQLGRQLQASSRNEVAFSGELQRQAEQIAAVLALHPGNHVCHDERGKLQWFYGVACPTARALGVTA